MRVEELKEIIPTRKIMVVGDVMLDEYLWGRVSRISPEATRISGLLMMLRPAPAPWI